MSTAMWCDGRTKFHKNRFNCCKAEMERNTWHTRSLSLSLSLTHTHTHTGIIVVAGCGMHRPIFWFHPAQHGQHSPPLPKVALKSVTHIRSKPSILFTPPLSNFAMYKTSDVFNRIFCTCVPCIYLPDDDLVEVEICRWNIRHKWLFTADMQFVGLTFKA